MANFYAPQFSAPMGAPVAPRPALNTVAAPQFAAASPAAANGAPIPMPPRDYLDNKGNVGTPQRELADKMGYSGTSNSIVNGQSIEQAGKAAGWSLGTSDFKPWLSNGQDAEQTRANYLFGGTPGAAQAFNAQVGQQAQQAQGQFGSIAGQATGAANAAYGAQAGAATAQAVAQGRDTGQFVDRTALSNSQSDRGAQLASAGQLMGNGYALQGLAGQAEGPSAAQGQLNQATNANMDNALALARSGRGMGGSAAGLRQAMSQNAATQQQAVNQSAVLRAQETQAYRQNQLAALNGANSAFGASGGVAGQARSADIAQGSYVSGTQQATQNSADAAAAQYGNQGVAYGQQALGAGQLALGAVQGNNAAQMGALGLQNNVIGQETAANQNYENFLSNKHFGLLNAPTKGSDYTPYIQAGAAVAAALI
jgi:hypothetical protein